MRVPFLLVGFVLASVWSVAAVVPAESAGRAQSVPATPTPPAIWSGVYSAAQATRGKHTFENHCRSCHGDDLTGGDGPGLIGEGFLRNWLEDDLNSLFTKIQTRMPADNPNTLTPGEYADLLAFLLQVNGFPVGEKELAPDHTALARVPIVGPNGPAPVPDSALVQVVGCLNVADKRWFVSKGSDPVRTRDPGASSAEDLQAWDSRPLGTQTFTLLDADTAALAPYKNRKVLAKGFLLKRPDGRSLNTTWVGPLATSCVQE